MKKLLLTVAVLALLAGTGLLISNHYKNYQHKQAQDSAQRSEGEAQANQERAAQEQAKQAEFTAQLEALRAECEKGRVAYAKLAPSLQAETPEPLCGPAPAE